MRKLLIFLSLLPILGFSQQPLVAEGQTMGTTYRVIYFDEPSRRDFATSIDSLLREVNRAISNYDPTSEVSRFNRSKRGIKFDGPHLREILRVAKSVHRASGGAFDPTVMPLVNAWGFGPGEEQTLTDEGIDSLVQLVDFGRIRVGQRRVRKPDPRMQVDLGGIGQGYGADVISAFLRSKGIEHLLVELGGEGRASGRNIEKDRSWTIGILHPHSTPTNQFFKAYVPLVEEAYTTSGNYFNYVVVDGRRYGHTIDPRTGRPVHHALLSASVFAGNCTLADAWATAFMVMGFDRAKDVANENGLDAVFMYSTSDDSVETYITPGIRDRVSLE